jgi:hypothetical protein
MEFPQAIMALNIDWNIAAALKAWRAAFAINVALV